MMWLLMTIAICYNQLPSTFAQFPIVNIPGLGSVQGSIGLTTWTNRTIYQFQGIPYAEAPIGKLRFQPPVKRAAWSGILDASQPGIRCPQISPFDTYVNVDNEDCLTLSVYSNNLDKNRPVLVWIHGGYFYFGGANQYKPNYLLESDIVLVVIQYRLGPLGFLSLQNDQIPGNAAALDAIMALEWVQQHIVHFGGNPMEVTVNGGSAGAVISSAMLYSPLVQNRANPLFQRMILQSGSIFSTFAICETPVEGSMDIARKAGCTDEATVEQCLQQVPIVNLFQGFMSYFGEIIKNVSYPRVAGACIVVGGPSGLLPQHPRNYLESVPKDVALMAGTTAQDGMFLLDLLFKFHPEAFPGDMTAHGLLQFIRLLQVKFGHTKLDGALEGYQLMENFDKTRLDKPRWKDVVPGFIDICGNYALKGPLLLDIHAVSAVNPNNTFLYSFDFSGEFPEANLSFPFPYKGEVKHSEELHYLFLTRQLNDRETKMAKTIIQLWSSFVRSGVPRANSVPYWRSVNRLYGPYLRISDEIEQRNSYLDEFRATSDKFLLNECKRKNGGRSKLCHCKIQVKSKSNLFVAKCPMFHSNYRFVNLVF